MRRLQEDVMLNSRISTIPVAGTGKMTVNSRFGTKVAVLAGDFLFAQSSWFLANLDNLEVGFCGSVWNLVGIYPLCMSSMHESSIHEEAREGWDAVVTLRLEAHLDAVTSQDCHTCTHFNGCLAMISHAADDFPVTFCLSCLLHKWMMKLIIGYFSFASVAIWMAVEIAMTCPDPCMSEQSRNLLRWHVLRVQMNKLHACLGLFGIKSRA
jgi:hypothetical protein